jgi:small subunit ribosomal protein S18
MARLRGRRTFRCRFCREGVGEVDYKDVDTISKLLTSQSKIFSRKRSGNCARHQRSLKRAIKRARFLSLVPYIG